MLEGGEGAETVPGLWLEFGEWKWFGGGTKTGGGEKGPLRRRGVGADVATCEEASAGQAAVRPVLRWEGLHEEAHPSPACGL